jgi:uncharacterized repeat protein (TIGR03803 family)
VYKLDSKGRETVLYSFTGYIDGSNPKFGVVLDSAGNLYGTTEFGGYHDNGVLYKLDSTGKETVLHSFEGSFFDATFPEAVRLGSDGNLYGTTFYSPDGCGWVYKSDLAGNLTVLYDFTDPANGCRPTGVIIFDSAGNLYGTTIGGGVYNFGVVYKLAPSGTLTALHSFTGGADGGTPQDGVLLGR